MFDQMSHAQTVWDEELQHGFDSYNLLQQLTHGIDNHMQDVIWDEAIGHNIDFPGLLPHQAEHVDFPVCEKRMSTAAPFTNYMFSQEQVTTVTMSRRCENLGKEEVTGVSKCNQLSVSLDNYDIFEEMAHQVVWDDFLDDLDSHEDSMQQVSEFGEYCASEENKIISHPSHDNMFPQDDTMARAKQQLAQGGKNFIDKTKMPTAELFNNTESSHVCDFPFVLELANDSADDMFNARPFGPVIWDEDMASESKMHYGLPLPFADWVGATSYSQHSQIYVDTLEVVGSILGKDIIWEEMPCNFDCLGNFFELQLQNRKDFYSLIINDSKLMQQYFPHKVQMAELLVRQSIIQLPVNIPLVVEKSSNLLAHAFGLSLFLERDVLSSDQMLKETPTVHIWDVIPANLAMKHSLQWFFEHNKSFGDILAKGQTQE